MATDSTELTFVRCPSCRSLVPAMSTRCRMCGATLEAVAKDDSKSSDAQKQQGRVRQRTMSQPDQELESGLGEVRESKPAAPAGGEQKGKDLEIDDPLRDFLEEIPMEEEKGAKRSEGTQSNGSMDDSRVVIESGKGARNEGLSFGKPRAEQKPEPKQEAKPEVKPEPKHEPRHEARNEQRTEPRHESRPDPKPESRHENQGGASAQRQPQRQQQQQPQRDSRPREESRSQSHQQQNREQRDSRPPRRDDQRDNQPAAREQRQAKAADRGPQTAPQSGRLFGWLVSYDDPNGSAIELREGKFFVSNEQLKPNDLVLGHESVSTPHAVVVTEVGVGIHVQDLMSDNGVFVKRRGESEYEKQEDRVAVAHGDWLRFGEVEFLVSLVAHVGVK